ncbi:MAG: hypothetical protein E6713_09990 [Sporomusaceae bacterium]|nr:hypothetical protein [Sporomusaceae bacterium]
MNRSMYEYIPCEDQDQYHYFDQSLYCRLVNCFRLLWEQHVYWTRMFIMVVVFDLPDLAATQKRLLRNPNDFAKTFDQFYGEKVSHEINRLITDHLTIGAELVKAAKAGKNKLAANTENHWYKNADDIACFLNHINPYWSVESMQAMWYKHLSLTKEETVTMLNGKYSKSICLLNEIERKALMMADTFANGIFKHFDDCNG